MEHSSEAISIRVARINSEIVGKNSRPNNPLLTREALLDVLTAIFEECSLESLRKYDKNIAQFVEKYRDHIKEIKQLRVNLSDFEIKNVIGRGHYGEVHLVKERQTGDVYAMKAMRKFENDMVHISFEEERDIMVCANSPWLTSLQYSFQDSSYLYYIMEYHPGGDLLGLLYRQGGTLPESAATFYLSEVVSALEDLHKMGFAHRDVKPDNILLDRCGHLKLADFGSAAKLDKNGLITTGPPVGTPDYVAPELLQCLDNKNQNSRGYGVSCDFWSLGILAYELVIGNTPFTGQTSSSIYSKIMNHTNVLKFPPDVTLSQAYVSFVKSLLVDEKTRLQSGGIKQHDVFKNVNFETLRDQVPPFVPKITSLEDTSNFSDVQSRQNNPSIENFKKRTQFSGRNLPFVGFTFTHDPSCFETNYFRKVITKDEVIEGLKSEIASLRKKAVKSDEFDQEKYSLEKKLEEKTRKLEIVEERRNTLEKELATQIAECAALKRTLELERKERSELEKKALDLIKSAKQKWETAEKQKSEAFSLELEQQKEKINQLITTNNILNEQLQHALKMESKHKESLEKVHNMNRRSVVGLESRLERITTDSQGAITELQRKLSDEIHQKKILENNLSKMKEKENNLLDKVNQQGKDFNKWQKKIFEAETEVQKLNEEISVLQRKVEKIPGFKQQIEKLQEVIDNHQKTVKELENKNKMLQNENRTMGEYKKEMEDLKKIITKLENSKKVAELESQLLEEREKCLELRQQLQEWESLKSENEELKSLRTKYWKMEKEFGNAKIDKRILERELKEAQAEIKQLNEKLENLDKVLSESKKMHELAMLELSNINENISQELIKARGNCKNLEDKLENEKDKNLNDKTCIQELKDILRSKDQEIAHLKNESDEYYKEKSLVERRCKMYEEEKSKLMGQIERLHREKAEVFDNLNESKREYDNLKLNFEALKEACTLLEHQVIEYERLIATHEAKQSVLNCNTDKLVQDICKAKEDIQEAKKLANEEKSLRILAETKIKRLNEDIECLQKEAEDYKQKCMEYKQYSTNLSDDLTLAEEKIAELEVAVNVFQRQVEDYQSESRALKEELSEYITQISLLKDSNYKYKHQVSELRDKKIMLAEKLNELERILDEKSHYYKQREMKNDATIKQHVKLIDYLQTKIDELSNKKRTITEVLFGSSKKENQPPMALPLHYKDLELELLKEKQLNKQLQEEVYKLKAATIADEVKNVADKMKVDRHKSEIMSPKSKLVLQQIVNSPSKQKDMYRQNSVQRMHHNIPHRYESKICTKSSTKCAGCSETISLGRSVMICSECQVQCHSYCSKKVPNTCGLPQMFAKHYRDSLEKKKKENVIATSVGDDKIHVKGWIKVASRPNGWEKRFAVLTDHQISIYTGAPEENGQLLETFELKPKDTHGKVISEPLSSEIAAPLANTDLPFVLKVEVSPNTTCWPPKCLVFLTLSAQDKDKWFSALQKIYYDDLEKPRLDTILQLPENISANCLIDLTPNIKVLGTEQGMYSYYEGNLLKIEGLDELHQISLMLSTGNAIMIVNKKRTLAFCDINHLINLTQCAQCTKPTLKYIDVNVRNLNGFHTMQVSQHSKHHKICVATTKQLIILEHEADSNQFQVIRILDTAQPTTCALFTENSLIVGANKFFEIDLQSYDAEEFLDISDVRLKQVEKCYKMRSFPVAILEINKNPKEYLLCFNEFSVFADEYGRSSRQAEIKSTHVPVALHFSKPYLYTVQFAAVEILKITDETCNSTSNEQSTDITRLPLEKFRNIGYNKHGLYIVQAAEVKFLDAKKIVDADISSTMSESGESDGFSFTSSMLQSLDGNLSDIDSLDDRNRKVTFSQTDL
ncbi:unnamed protein product [Acanthoscelides obtectus]|uniref:non-specific serine/threonine protein kinase n=1 Tax=Acanthoscelides obtectus TaxID=200917 RepID=A0A9P0KP31_ACAOB|nr:unnamed protein product [Acanthoscelides obtectus]CAK1658332.1 Citron Rho-interacting kinase [Acanthoscelides obtectus]